MPLTQGFTNYNAINAFANYDFSIGKHDIAIMGGYNQEESHKESQWSQRTDVLLENSAVALRFYRNGIRHRQFR